MEKEEYMYFVLDLEDRTVLDIVDSKREALDKAEKVNENRDLKDMELAVAAKTPI